MAYGAKLQSVPASVPVLGSGSQAFCNSPLAKLSATSLADLCHRLKVQLIQQRLPLICRACHPNLVRAFNMEVNLTQMLRGLCKVCRALFMSNSYSPPHKKPSEAQPDFELLAPTEPLKIKRILFKVPDSRKPKSPLPPRNPARRPPLLRTIPIFEALSKSGIDWCRYCGTTNGINWRPGPWGQRTLCNKHGCAYHGYGFSKGLARLDLSAYQHETDLDRKRPIVQGLCAVCHTATEPEIACYGCPRAFHPACLPASLPRPASPHVPWFCTEECPKSYSKRSVSVACVKDRPSDRVLAEPTPVAAKRRFAKRFDSASHPPTPPPTPLSARKRRATSDGSYDVLVCFEPDTAANRPLPAKTLVFTPSFRPVSLPVRGGPHTSPTACLPLECLEEEGLLIRHSRYEEVEKTMRLLRPEVLRTLYSPQNTDTMSSYESTI